MKGERCQYCGLDVTGAKHRSAEECLRHLAPRYELAQRALRAIHKRYQALEERLERAKIQERVARKDSKQSSTILRRIERLEKLTGAV